MGRESVTPFAPLIVAIVEFQQALGKKASLIVEREKIKGRYIWRPEKPEKARCMEGWRTGARKSRKADRHKLTNFFSPFVLATPSSMV
ncbi:hypothetical protein PENSUB_1135 [Penicillium subrubescens]|uniref:Uncharacterized protein n=1 Tax=Penicillium subrubescens TaxID=1316194 RepID=A0A1Q5UKM1_9EURO|nr:hypothetical protein PENSUB_1135 [Penicillium subrubescens]